MQNFTWLENLVMDPPSSSLFVSELKTGTVWKVQSDQKGGYFHTAWVTGFHKVLGLTRNPAMPGTIFFVGEVKEDQPGVYKFSSTTPGNYTRIAETPPGLIGNGFGCHYATGKCGISVLNL
jgi:hypothetical protein